MPDTGEDRTLLLAAACVPVPEALFVMLCQPDAAASRPLSVRQERLLAGIATASALAFAAILAFVGVVPPT